MELIADNDFLIRLSDEELEALAELYPRARAEKPNTYFSFEIFLMHHAVDVMRYMAERREEQKRLFEARDSELRLREYFKNRRN